MEYGRDLSHIISYMCRHLDQLLLELAESFPSAIKLGEMLLATEKRTMLLEMDSHELMSAYFGLFDSLAVPTWRLSSSFSAAAATTSTLTVSSSNRKRLRASAHEPTTTQAYNDVTSITSPVTMTNNDEEQLYTDDAIEALLAQPTASERVFTAPGMEIMALLHARSYQVYNRIIIQICAAHTR